MSKVKLKNYGLKDIIYFTNKPKEREKRIQETPPARSGAMFKCNMKAAERHPDEQLFVIESITDRGKDRVGVQADAAAALDKAQAGVLPVHGGVPVRR